MAPSAPVNGGPVASSMPPASPASLSVAPLCRPEWLAASLSTLLHERTTLDKSAIARTAPALQLIAMETEEWIEWSEAEREWEEQREAREAERIVQLEERAALEAEAVAAAADAAAAAAKKQAATPTKGTPAKGAAAASAASVASPTPAASTAAAAKKMDAMPEIPISSALALQLCNSEKLCTRFVEFLMHTVLVHPNPVTHVNEALLLDPPSRRIAFALLQLACQAQPANLRLLLAWVGERHGGTRADQVLRQSGQTEVDEDEEWSIDPSTSQRSSTGFVGLKNQAATCYQNSFLQLLFHSPAFRKELMTVREIANADGAAFDEKAEITLLSRVQSIFFYLMYSCKRFFDPIAFVKSFKGWDGQPLNPNVQQDVSEFCGMLFDRLESCLDQAARDANEPKRPNLVKRVFGGQLQNELICSEYPAQLDHKFVRLEQFQVLPLAIRGCKTLHDALNNFVTGEMLEGSNAYMCSLCKQKRDTQKRCIIHTWPRLVIFNLKRFEFDYETLKTKKLNDELAFPLQIDLHPWTEAGMAKKDALAKEAAERKAAEEHEEKKESDVDVVAEHLQHHTLPLDVDKYYPCACGRKADVHCGQCAKDYCNVHEEQAHADLRAAAAASASADPATAASADPPAPTAMYRLVGVLVHAGHAEGGHYYSYIRSASTGKWHEFNDKNISDFNPDQMPLECFGGMEDPEPDASKANGTPGDTAGQFEAVNHKGRRRRNRQNKQGGGGAANGANEKGEQWQTAKLEKSRNAYLLWYERIEDASDEQPTCNGSNSDASLASSLQSLSLSPSPLSSAAVAPASSSSSPLSPTSTALSGALSPTSFYKLDPKLLPPMLAGMHARIKKENAQQLWDEMQFEKAWHGTLYNIARDAIEWVPARAAKAKDAEASAADEAEEKSSPSSVDPSLTLAAGKPGVRYLSDISSLDESDLSVMFLQNLTLFVLETVARADDRPRMDAWCSLLQHGYNAHIGCCQWLLERFVLHPEQLSVFLLECPSASTRKSIANLLEVVTKKLIRFELDEAFVDTFHIVLPALKPLAKREDAQAGLAAALGDAASASSASSASAAAAAVSSSSSSKVAQSSSSASFLSSALVQSACAEAQGAPEGLFKPGAKSTVAVSAKLKVLDGVGTGTEAQFNKVGIKTLQNLVEITPGQREAIAKAPAGGMTQAVLEGILTKAQRAVEYILEKSGVNEKIAEQKAADAAKAERLRKKQGADFVGPRLLPAFIRTCLQTLRKIETTNGANVHCCPELCEMLGNLASANVAMLRLLIEQGAIQTCVQVIVSPITFVEQVREKKRLKKLEESGEATKEAAEEEASEEQGDQQEEEPAEAEEEEKPAPAAASTPAKRGKLTEEEEMAEAIAAVAAAEAAEAAKAKKEARKQAKKERNSKKQQQPLSPEEEVAAAEAAEVEAAVAAANAAAAADAAAAAAASADSDSAAAADDSKHPEGSPDASRQASTESVASSKASSGDGKDDEEDDDDELTDLEDLSMVEMVAFLLTLVRATTTRYGKPEEPVQPNPAPLPSIPEDAWASLRSPKFLRRLVLQISSAKLDAPCMLAAHLAWENHDFTDGLLDAIFTSMDQKDFFDFYAGVKILQHLLLNVHDSVHEYRVEVSMPRLLKITSENQSYYKATELCIKSFMHLVQHDARVMVWAKAHLADFAWMEGWLSKNKAMPPAPKKDGTGPPEGVALFTIKFGKTDGVTQKWEKQWDGQTAHKHALTLRARDVAARVLGPVPSRCVLVAHLCPSFPVCGLSFLSEQISEYGIGLAESDSISDYVKIFRKMVLACKTKK